MQTADDMADQHTATAMNTATTAASASMSFCVAFKRYFTIAATYNHILLLLVTSACSLAAAALAALGVCY